MARCSAPGDGRRLLSQPMQHVPMVCSRTSSRKKPPAPCHGTVRRSAAPSGCRQHPALPTDGRSRQPGAGTVVFFLLPALFEQHVVGDLHAGVPESLGGTRCSVNSIAADPGVLYRIRPTETKISRGFSLSILNPEPRSALEWPGTVPPVWVVGVVAVLGVFQPCCHATGRAENAGRGVG